MQKACRNGGARGGDLHYCPYLFVEITSRRRESTTRLPLRALCGTAESAHRKLTAMTEAAAAESKRAVSYFYDDSITVYSSVEANLLKPHILK